MSATNDGGPAFPHGEIVQEIRGENCEIIGNGVWCPYPDMTLRDWFAGQALASMPVAPDYSKVPCDEAMAQRAYFIADAMLAARNGGRT